MISLYGEKIYKCKICGGIKDTPFSEDVCSICRYKELVSKTNSLCLDCKKKCKQSSLISIQHCPDYNSKTSFKVPRKPVEPSSSKSQVSTSKKPKKTAKRKKRKKR